MFEVVFMYEIGDFVFGLNDSLIMDEIWNNWIKMLLGELI